MDLQKALTNVFGKGLNKADCLFNWKETDLKNFTDDELNGLIKTCVAMRHESELAATVLKRCWNVKYKRHIKNKYPTIKPTKSKGARNAKRKNGKPKR